MQNQELVSIIRQGVQVWNKWRRANPKIQPNFDGLDFSRDLKDLRKADLHMTSMEGAWFNGVDLSGADLSHSRLRGANLYGANLSNATLNGAWLSQANLLYANLTGAILNDAHLEYAILAEVNLEAASLRGCEVYGISAWGIQGTPKDQSNLRMTLKINWSPDGLAPPDEFFVPNLESAHLMYSLLDHKNVGNMISTLAERGVLLLGGFKDGGLENLRAIAAALKKKRNYVPFIFDFDRPPSRNLTETVLTLAGLSKFVIADLSGPSVPKELEAIIPRFKIPIAPIIQKDQDPYATFSDYDEEQHVLEVEKYSDLQELTGPVLSRVIEAAEKYHAKRREGLNKKKRT
jgi:uncharacterized protein YjbI with pentapeptide repeats